MSWITTSLLIVAIVLGGSFAFSEWLVRRRGASGSDDGPSLG